MLKRIAIVLALSLPLGACVTTELPALWSTATAPVSLDNQYQVEAAVYAVRRTTTQYFALRQCRASEVASLVNQCARRSIKVRLQAADLRVRNALTAFRANPTVLTGIKSAISNYQQVLIAEKVN